MIDSPWLPTVGSRVARYSVEPSGLRAIGPSYWDNPTKIGVSALRVTVSYGVTNMLVPIKLVTYSVLPSGEITELPAVDNSGRSMMGPEAVVAPTGKVLIAPAVPAAYTNHGLLAGAPVWADAALGAVTSAAVMPAMEPVRANRERRFFGIARLPHGRTAVDYRRSGGAPS